MPAIDINSVDTAPAGLGKKPFERAAGAIANTDILPSFLTTRERNNLSEAFRSGRDMTAAARKKHALESLLSAVVSGNEALVRKIITSRSELLLDASAIVTDLSGKEIKGLTPLQAAICAGGDVDMVQMIIDVLQQKLKDGKTLSFEPTLEIQRQFSAIYPNGDIEAVEAEQIANAQKFKTQESENVFNLSMIFAKINAATDAEVQAELTNPGQHTDSQLNATLHTFRAQFAATSNQEQIFNPFYLLKAFEFYDEKFDNFNGNDHSQWNRRNLFWCQVIGYIQRHLPACYLQAFAQGPYYIVKNNEKLKRGFEFRHDKGFYMRPTHDLNSLGYKFATRAGAGRGPWEGLGGRGAAVQKLLRTKKSSLENLRAESKTTASHRSCRAGA
jgi:hypothetical protein